MKIKYQNKYGKRIILKCDFCGEVYETLEIKAIIFAQQNVI